MRLEFTSCNKRSERLLIVQKNITVIMAIYMSKLNYIFY